MSKHEDNWTYQINDHLPMYHLHNSYINFCTLQDATMKQYLIGVVGKNLSLNVNYNKVTPIYADVLAYVSVRT